MAVPASLRRLILPPTSPIPQTILLSNLRTSHHLSLCPLCTLRFLPCFNPIVYATPLQTLAQTYASILTKDDINNAIYNDGQAGCRGCAGVLCRVKLSELEEAIREGMQGIVHDGRWWLSVAIAGDIGVLRQKVLRKEYGHETKWKEVDLKVGLRMTLGERVKIDGMTLAVAGKKETPGLVVGLEFKGKEGGRLEQGVLVGSEELVGKKRARERRGKRRSVLLENKNSARISNHQIGLTANSMSQEELVRHTGHLESWSTDGLEVTCKVTTGSVWVAGRYRKLVRGISQTAWAGKEVRGSVEEIVRDAIIPVLGGKNICFSAAGREDVDVRMLGTGRPFVVEISDGKRVPSRVTGKELKKIEESVNRGIGGKGAVQIHGLKVVGRDFYALMKESEAIKRKQYRCVVWLEKALEKNELQGWVDRINRDGGITLKQKTPLRVLHRRTLMVREKRIWSLELGRIISPGVFVLNVEAAAGTYIKEFVHGDLGRTIPNIGSMLTCEADILQLDVTGIKADI